MRVLIVYASRHGQTQRICKRIADVIETCGGESHLFSISELPRALAPQALDVVVIAGSVYFGKHSKELERFVTRYREDLRKTRTAFLSVSGSAKSVETRVEAERAADAFLQRTGWRPDRVELVAGGEPYTRYGFFTKWIMVMRWKHLGRVIDTKRDYEYTDWDRVESFAHELMGNTADVGRALARLPG